MAQLGDILAELRQERGLTQKELGQILCVSTGTISNYETGVHLPDAYKIMWLSLLISQRKSPDYGIYQRI